MYLKYTLAGFLLLLTVNVIAQSGSVYITPIYDTAAVIGEQGNDNFCEQLVQLWADASSGFVKSKGKEIEAHSEEVIWSSNVGLPGTVTSSLIFTKSWRFEGLMYLGTSEEDMKIYYDKYTKVLDSCLLAKGYALSIEDNKDKRVEKYRRLVYSRQGEKKKEHVPQISIDVEYAENTGIYSIAVNVWQGGK